MAGMSRRPGSSTRPLQRVTRPGLPSSCLGGSPGRKTESELYRHQLSRNGCDRPDFSDGMCGGSGTADAVDQHCSTRSGLRQLRHEQGGSEVSQTERAGTNRCRKRT